MKKISIVIPVFNEEKNLPTLYEQLTKLAQEYHNTYTFEYIYVNDGSHDNSWNIITKQAQINPAVKGILFSRNFGHQLALSAGYDHTTGDAVISMDADMQTPTVIIHQFIHAWEQGADIVYAQRSGREDTFFKKITAHWYYKLLEKVGETKIPHDVCDFRLLDKKVVLELRKCKEHARYLRGMVAWLGFKQVFVPYVHVKRVAGTSGYTWKKMFKLAFDGLAGFSVFPLRIAAYIGSFVILTGCAMFAYITFDTILHHVYYPLFKWLVTIIYIFMGLQFILLWFIGEYIGRIYEEEKGRPLYIVSEKIGL